MLEIILKGILIGIIVSAPMGPVGVLCVQRSLNKGRWDGFVTGMGAVISDLIYAVATGWGMSFVLSFIEENRLPVQITGSIFLLIFSYFSFKSDPTPILNRKGNTGEKVYWKDFVSGFLLTLSNVGIIFFYIALFARFGFVNSEQHILTDIMGMLSIGIGATLWWLFITTLIHRLRHRFNVRGLKAFNILLGSILFIIGLIGLISGITDYMQSLTS